MCSVQGIALTWRVIERVVQEKLNHYFCTSMPETAMALALKIHPMLRLFLANLLKPSAKGRPRFLNRQIKEINCLLSCLEPAKGGAKVPYIINRALSAVIATAPIGKATHEEQVSAILELKQTLGPKKASGRQ